MRRYFPTTSLSVRRLDIFGAVVECRVKAAPRYASPKLLTLGAHVQTTASVRGNASRQLSNLKPGLAPLKSSQLDASTTLTIDAMPVAPSYATTKA